VQEMMCLRFPHCAINPQHEVATAKM